MATFCQNVQCEGKARIENGMGIELKFVPYSATACVVAGTKAEAAKKLTKDYYTDVCWQNSQTSDFGKLAPTRFKSTVGEIFQKK